MVSFPNAKINLGLNIVAKRPDGYHDLETCFLPLGWSDILEIVPASKFDFKTTGEPIPGSTADNLCVKAYDLLRKDFNLPDVYLHLHKIVPMGAGLGGGSSDAAWALRMLNEIFNLNLGKNKLIGYASQLGSDCAFFLYDEAKLGTGRGNVLSDITIPSITGKFIVVVKPHVHVSTAEAYAGVTPRKPENSVADVLKLPVTEWRGILKNDFEESVFKKYPAISDIKSQLYKSGALYASLSGSGSAVFGIFSDDINLENQFPGCGYWSGLCSKN